MSTWYSVDLGDGIAATAPRTKILELFTPIFAAEGAKLDMSVFSRYDSDRNIITVYFCPSARTLAKTFNAIPCEKPSSEDLALLAGDARAWNIHFPDKTLE